MTFIFSTLLAFSSPPTSLADLRMTPLRSALLSFRFSLLLVCAALGLVSCSSSSCREASVRCRERACRAGMRLLSSWQLSEVLRGKALRSDGV
ncbi:hypothetical protein EON65_17705 [archaeon]|nr:MAG: hypothetical protein EON65_17705 [archaeon]